VGSKRPAEAAEHPPKKGGRGRWGARTESVASPIKAARDEEGAPTPQANANVSLLPFYEILSQWLEIDSAIKTAKTFGAKNLLGMILH